MLVIMDLDWLSLSYLIFVQEHIFLKRKIENNKDECLLSYTVTL